MNGSDFKIDAACPRCGAPVVLKETESMVQCGFCKTRHAIHTHPFPCYYMEPGPKTPAGADILYVPYWRFKGMEFNLDADPPGFRIMDHSCLAVHQKGLPPSLGLRPQARPLKFVQKDVPGRFLSPEISGKNAIRQMSGQAEGRVYIGETLSLLYMPFFKNQQGLCDGLTGAPLASLILDLPAGPNTPGQTVSFSPCLCPDCGWDLTGRTDSLVIHCSNCTSFWLIRNKKIGRVETGFSAHAEDSNILMPFWRFSVEFSRITLSSYADLIRMANIPKAVQEAHEKMPMHFYIPAFKINPKLFLRIAKQMTLAQIAPGPAGKISGMDILSADLELEEGAQAVFPALATMATPKKDIIGILKTEKLKIKEFSLIYIAFQASGNDYVQPELRISLPKNSLLKGFKP